MRSAGRRTSDTTRKSRRCDRQRGCGLLHFSRPPVVGGLGEFEQHQSNLEPLPQKNGVVVKVHFCAPSPSVILCIQFHNHPDRLLDTNLFIHRNYCNPSRTIPIASSNPTFATKLDVVNAQDFRERRAPSCASSEAAVLTTLDDNTRLPRSRRSNTTW